MLVDRVLLCSLLQNDRSVFAYLALAFELFALFPLWCRHVAAFAPELHYRCAALLVALATAISTAADDAVPFPRGTFDSISIVQSRARAVRRTHRRTSTIDPSSSASNARKNSVIAPTTYAAHRSLARRPAKYILVFSGANVTASIASRARTST